MSSASATLMACPALPDRSIAAASAAALALFARCSTFEARLAKLDMFVEHGARLFQGGAASSKAQRGADVLEQKRSFLLL